MYTILILDTKKKKKKKKDKKIKKRKLEELVTIKEVLVEQVRFENAHQIRLFLVFVNTLLKFLNKMLCKITIWSSC